MSHEPDLNLLAAFHEGRTAPSEREAILSHLAECRECRDVLSLLAKHVPRPAPAAQLRVTALRWLPIAATLAVATAGLVLVSGALRNPSSPASDVSPAPAASQPQPGDRSNAAASPSPRADTPAKTGETLSAQPEDVLRTRTGQRIVGAKTFRLVAGEWVDGEYDPAALLPVVDVPSAAARRELLARIPTLAAFAAVGERVTVVHEGTVYRFGAAPR